MMISVRKTVNVPTSNHAQGNAQRKKPKKKAEPSATSSVSHESRGGDGERIDQRIPASIQAMLSRSKCSLSESEIKAMVNSTAEDRCTALRMVFEGQSADEAIAFLLGAYNGKDSPKRSKTKSASSLLPIIITGLDNSSVEGARSNEWDAGSTAVFCGSSNSKESLSSAEVAPPLLSMQQTIWNSALLTDCESTAAHSRSVSPSIRMPSPKSHGHQIAKQPLTEVAVNTMSNTHVTSKAMGDHYTQLNTTGSPLTMSVTTVPTVTAQGPSKQFNQSTCSAWDERLQTYIVHPNQLRCVGELEKMRTSPDAVRRGGGAALRRLTREGRTHSPVGGIAAARQCAQKPISTRNGELVAPLQMGHDEQHNRGFGNDEKQPQQRQRESKKTAKGVSESGHQEQKAITRDAATAAPKSPSGKENVFARLFSASKYQPQSYAATERSRASTSNIWGGLSPLNSPCMRLCDSVHEESASERHPVERVTSETRFSHYGSALRLQRTQSAIDSRYRTQRQRYFQSFYTQMRKPRSELHTGQVVRPSI
ncbi:hypothetical protein DPX39_100133100 [Trypanosoma brucei equiperdum]|uniref:Uncharacterized protein n=1 Tax=Trypanosoma brucei equiperdum TaxID=630700 RepID=A0A3L6L0Y5_9TRYP|nr:hypothetical protein DPX39_100133100 [Trypanosoma brucei equiperdum]